MIIILFFFTFSILGQFTGCTSQEYVGNRNPCSLVLLSGLRVICALLVNGLQEGSQLIVCRAGWMFDAPSQPWAWGPCKSGLSPPTCGGTVVYISESYEFSGCPCASGSSRHRQCLHLACTDRQVSGGGKV
jgi:hypothetical protein